jgi:Zn-dependent M28 family amino/carboxypeptidase|uniref:M28 family peptidase n=1 Tax=Desulfobacca acetoxidans TaxID=60893 RepID=A0A7C3V6F6_9BACT
MPVFRVASSWLAMGLALGGLSLALSQPLDGESLDKDEIRRHLTRHLHYLAVDLGERCIFRPENLKAAENYVARELESLGFPVRRQPFICQRVEVANVIAGNPDPRGYYLLGAHFDTVAGTPGADDNASGVAVLLEVARLTQRTATPSPWAFVGFTTEEPPVYFTPYMGSRVYAKAARQKRENLLGMLCLESVGYFVTEPNSQQIPLALRFLGYSTTGDYLGLVANWPSRPLLQKLERAFLAATSLAVATLAVPLGGSLLPETRLSDHANFWDEGYPAVMLTDTAFLRNPNYHTPWDTMDTLNLDAMVELTVGLTHFVKTAGK